MSVDIIMPVYNAYDDLKVCLESLYANTDLNGNRLIIINDKSSDERISPFLEEQMRQGGNILVIHNEKNMGFSANINAGISQSDENDIILLNSDTVLTSGWLEKIVKCAYSSPSIGTVTPLSNNATLCSIPEFCEENVLPEGLNLDETADIVERHSLKKYPRISVANGFCMFVKREVIHDIGYFDAETFGRGYGEENDFCNRAEQVGYINVMCDDTYIYHSGTKSFASQEKEEYIRQHDQILRKRYPVQMRENDIYVRDNPNHVINDNFKMWFNICNKKRNILYVLHSDFRADCADNVGGTQFHVKDLKESFKDEANVFVLSRDNCFLQLTAYIGDREYSFRFFAGENGEFPVISSRKIREVMGKILASFGIDIVHVHHTSGTSMDIFSLCRGMGIPIYFTAHDFYCVCPSEKLLDFSWNVCDGHIDMEHCRECLGRQKGISERVDFISIWREKWSEAFGICEKIFTPSESAKNIIAGIYPDIPDKVMVIEHGMRANYPCYFEMIRDVEEVPFECFITKRQRNGFYYEIEGYVVMPPELKGRERLKIVLKAGGEDCYEYIPTNFRYTSIQSINENERGYFCCYIPVSFNPAMLKQIYIFVCQDGKWFTNPKCVIEIEDARQEERNWLRIAFIGGLNRAKGAEIASEMIRGKRDGVEWYVFGGLGNDKLECIKQDNLLKTNYYNPEDLPTLLRLHRIDAACVFSLWPETYSYTLSEAVLQGIPVVVSDIGALGERGRKYNGVTVIPMDSLKTELYGLMESWAENRQELLAQKQLAQANKFPAIGDMAAEYRAVYESSPKLECRGSKGLIDSGFILDAYRDGRNNNNLNNHDKREEKLALERMSVMEQELNRIYSSISYRFVTRLLRIKIPFREELKRILRRRM